MENVAQEMEKAISGAIKVDEKEIRDHLDGLVRQSVEDTLNALLNAEADAICPACAKRAHFRPPVYDLAAADMRRYHPLRQCSAAVLKFAMFPVILSLQMELSAKSGIKWCADVVCHSSLLCPRTAVKPGGQR